MSTYDGAYSNNRGAIYKGGWNDVCVCEDGELSANCTKCTHNMDGTKKPDSVINDLRKAREILESTRIQKELSLLDN
ncbi:hypothetical protein BI001_gp202 [Bacillus phage Zuko]|uniref:hypothetical protein n=1 Tax=Bacillus phage Zuko TaxID=1805956 RepID=UPI0007A76A20|nr:hypothetical protein BI001_gp202 [Bacillus phage Zuko]AMW62530.1 hypothetical protein ZUKO_176 [Bacillus phage Zuko]